ncbi:hypothetical protein RM530_11970 [Algiphilus sp. W345]|uniref:Uncharacterized protein n=1 Tax=Banduia mediterranea TaxID=3075609 RepID=A0ABU2WKD3_9GAMM|nr:hypothetical protein [Algiphilus sp. W345]MDT0498074.1 hypothetical protein [Algiphilus sp. W345]
MVFFVFNKFRKMPWPLLLFSVTPVVVTAMFSVGAAMPGFRVVVFGNIVSRNIWWMAGGGLLTLMGFLIFIIPLWMLVLRKPFARSSLMAAWLAFSVVSYFIIPTIAEHVGESAFMGRMTVSLPIAVVGLILGAYLALSKDVLMFVSGKSDL